VRITDTQNTTHVFLFVAAVSARSSIVVRALLYPCCHSETHCVEIAMNAMKREDMGAYRQQLQSLADRLAGGIAQLTTEATRPTGAEGAEAEKPTREPMGASNEGDEETARGILLSEEELLAEVRAAIARFDAGAFGRCEQCGRSIGKTRLKAVPYARRCIACAQVMEGSKPS
jgi:RNA polymerase-binding transcription factor DksA